MSSYKYDPTEGWRWPRYIGHLEMLKKANGGKWWNALSTFFKKPEIQKWIENNEWEKVFEAWRPTAGFIQDLLAFFLWMVDVDFMKYLPDKFVENSTIESEHLRKK